MICAKCSTKRPAKMFAPDAKHRTGVYAWCKPCKKERQKKYSKLRRQESEAGNTSRAPWYGLTDADYNELLALQGGCCAGCGRLPKEDRRLNIDHRHQPGDKKREPWERAPTVRGLLCHLCNRALGIVRDNPETLRRLLTYLETPPADTVVRPKLQRLLSLLDS